MRWKRKPLTDSIQATYNTSSAPVCELGHLPPRGKAKRKGDYLMAKLAKALLKLLKILGIVVAVLFVVYFWNLDQKVLGWAYKQVNAMFDRKKVDLVF